MKTIEERAKHYVSVHVCADKQTYIDGATEQKAIDIDKAWQFIEVTIIREGHASEDFVKEMNWRFKKAMEK